MRFRGAVLAAVVVAAPLAACRRAGEEAARPNFVVIMTDDQTVESLRVMPNVERLLSERGVTFTNSVVSYPLCCPSRASFLTGQYAHNHGVLGNEPPDGGYSAFRAPLTTLPAALRDAGYTTVHIGKYLNGYGLARRREVPAGWSDWHGLVDYSTYQYFDFTLNDNGRLRRPRGYQTHVLTDRATSAIRREADEDEPFFLELAFAAPHHELERRRPLSARRDRGAFATEPLPMPASFAEADVTDKPAPVAGDPPLDSAEIDAITRRYRAAITSLLAVDRSVARVVRALRANDELDDTVIVFTSDNGYFYGEHRVASGKVFPYEPSIRVPLVVRGPGVRAGATADALVANVDLAPTILELACARPLRPMDGRSLTGNLGHPRRPGSDRAVLLEAFGAARSGPYQGVRTERYVYIEYANGGREVYDLVADPDQLQNRHGQPETRAVEARLADRLAELRGCAGAGCR